MVLTKDELKNLQDLFIFCLRYVDDETTKELAKVRFEQLTGMKLEG